MIPCILVILESLVLTALSLYSEIISGNITHMRYGREPNAGAALFPLFPIGPAAIIAISYLLEKIWAGRGMWAASVFFMIVIVFELVRIRKAYLRFRKLESDFRLAKAAEES